VASTTTATATTPASDSIHKDIKALSPNDVSDDESKLDKEADYHYIAYVHIDGYIWELDGLQPEPIRLAACSKDQWVNEARLEFKARVLSFDDDEQSFVLMAMTKDPIVTLSQRIHSLRHSSFSSPKKKGQQQQREELELLEETLRREEMEREAEKSAIQEMEADYRPALEFFMLALTTLDHPPDRLSDLPMDIDDSSVIGK
jgi:ubiquitin carboxyl-terminal hydrolase L5